MATIFLAQAMSLQISIVILGSLVPQSVRGCNQRLPWRNRLCLQTVEEGEGIVVEGCGEAGWGESQGIVEGGSQEAGAWEHPAQGSGMGIETGMKKFIAISSVALIALAVFLYSKSPKTPPQPTTAQWQLAMSNNAVVYFRAGVACGVYVERVKPGLNPNDLVGASRGYFASLGTDPYLSPREGRVEKAERESAQVRPVKTPPKPTNSPPVTNSIYSTTNLATNLVDEVKP